MKAHSTMCATRPDCLGPTMDTFRILKQHVSDSEMQECFTKLTDLVPTIPHDRKLSKVALLQHVIDYILDLELTLEVHPSAVLTPPPQLLTTNKADRTPLGGNTQINTPAYIQHQASHLEKDDERGVCSRPASC